MNYKPFKRLKQNLYSSGITRSFIPLNSDSHPICKCKVENGCDDNCENKILYMECVAGLCPSLSNGQKYCSNSVIQNQLYPITEIFKSHKCGFGLRIKENVNKNKIIIEYLGEVITSIEGNIRMCSYKKSDDLYFMSLGDGLMLDAKAMGSIARFANHSCDPNCELQKWIVQGETRLVLVSIREIQAEEEITYNYQYFEDGLGDIPRQVCKCGAKCCSGTVGGRPVISEEKKWTTKAESIVSGSSKKYSLDEAREHLNLFESIKRDDTKKKKRPTKANKPMLDLLSSVDGDSNANLTISEEFSNYPSEYVLLKELVESADAWRAKALKYLTPVNGKTKVYKHKILKKLLDIAPVRLKINEKLLLENAISKSLKLDKRGSKLYSKTEDTKNNSSELGVNSSSSSISSSSCSNLVTEEPKPVTNLLEHTETSKMLWKDYLLNLKECYSICPVYSDTGVSLLNIYKKSSLWANKYINSHFYSAYCIQRKAANVFLRPSSDLKSIKQAKQELGYLTITYWPILKKLSSVYKISIQPDFLIACDILEESLQMYIRRIDLIDLDLNQNRHPIVFNQNNYGYIDQNNLSTDDSVNEIEETEKNNLDEDNNENKLFCFCCLPESSSEISVLQQCDFCKEWYHPPCVNQNINDKTNSFKCPLCLIDSNEINPFLLPITYEWSIDNRWRQSNKQPKKITSRKVDLLLASTISRTVNSEWDTNNSYPQMVDLGPITESLLIEIKASCQELPFFDCPAILLINLASKFISEWNIEVENELKRFVDFDPNYSREFVSKSEKLSNLFSPSTFHSEKEKRKFLILFLRLYYRTRVLNIQPELTSKLRKVIWDVSFDFSFIIDSSYNINNIKTPISLSLLSEIFKAGTYFEQQHFNHESNYRINSLKRLKNRIQLFLDEVQRFTSCLNLEKEEFPVWSESCMGMINFFEKEISKFIKLDTNFLYIKIKSFWSQYQLRCHQINDTVAEMTSFCICEGFDDGSFMICCDICDCWFHGRCIRYNFPKRIKKRKRNSSSEIKISNPVELAIEEIIQTIEKNIYGEQIHKLDVNTSNGENSFICYACKIDFSKSEIL